MADEHKASDGRGNFGNSEQHAEAGKKGGDETAKKGSDFYSEIGSKDSNDSNPGSFANRDDASEQGKKGGESRNSNQ